MIQEVCRAFTAFCRDLDLFSRDLVAIDGSKFKAVNSRERNLTDRKLKRVLKEIDQKIEAYLDEMDANNAQEPEERKLSAEQLKEKIRLLKERMKNYKGLQQRMEESGESQISLTDPDSRSMPIGGGRITDVGYNVQVTVDPKHKLIVDHQVTNAVTDRGLLSKMALRAKEALRIERLEGSSPSASKPPSGGESAGPTLPPPAPGAASEASALAALRTAASPAGLMRTCWRTCRAGSGPAQRR